MDTKQYISTLKKRSKEPVPVALRQALCYYLYNNRIPCCIIRDVIGMTRANVYLSIYKTRDMLEANDKIMREAYNEISQHFISVKPYTIEGNVLTKHVGYKLIIDNIIY